MKKCSCEISDAKDYNLTSNLSYFYIVPTCTTTLIYLFIKSPTDSYKNNPKKNNRPSVNGEIIPTTSTRHCRVRFSKNFITVVLGCCKKFKPN